MSRLKRFAGLKDPDDVILITFRVSLRTGDAVDTVTITEVDENDIPIPLPTLTLGTVSSSEADAFNYATCTVAGGLVSDKPVLLRSRWVFASGQSRDRTMRLYVGHN